ncbi:hypothetical protein NG844_10245 [Enterococcus faecalis]|uniref:hypothetical protein n=1 Tax=Enterococcus faecalis TaxID=1351 RepID=UPI002091A42F|nr:hypothetical protein [Enterococcus faecalis]MCO5447798.1 hypothetical protein [Enterococcus faecalis]
MNTSNKNHMFRLLMVSLFFFTCLITGTNALAADRGDKPRSGYLTEETMFGGQADSTEYMKMPEGGYLHGEATLHSLDDEGNVKVEKYNSRKEPKNNIITLGEIKENNNEEKKTVNKSTFPKEIDLRGTKPSNTVYDLSYKANYISNNFSGKGWRFAGYLFRAVNSAGSDLRWESHNDNGVIGSKQQAWNTLDSGYAEGYLINTDSYLYLSGTKTYYNHNPRNGAYYYVGNVD